MSSEFKPLKDYQYREPVTNRARNKLSRMSMLLYLNEYIIFEKYIKNLFHLLLK